MSATLSPLFTWRSAICESGLPAGTRHVALVLSLHMNERGGSCFPTLTALEAEVGVGRSSIVNSLRHLEQGGWISVDRKPNPGRGDKNTYAATFPEGFTAGPFLEKRVQGMALKGSPQGKEDVKEDVLKDSFKCNICEGLPFAGARGLANHLKNVHDIEQEVTV